MSKGYSRDHREDLNRVVLELITSEPSEFTDDAALSGNASDKTSFKDTIERHIGQPQSDGGGGSSMVVIDSAGFSQAFLAGLPTPGSP